MDNAVVNTISLCSGVGMLDEGMHAGLEYLGIRSRTCLFAEREAFPVGVLAARMQEGSLAPAPIWFGDFTELPARRFRGVVDGVVAGFPCQDLSVAGRRAGLNGTRSGLFFNVLDIADDSGAWFLFLENVAGIASATASVVDEEEGELEERAAARVMGELADRGWNAEWITLSASDVGASHGRARWFCFAWRMDDADRTRVERSGRAQQGADSRCKEMADAGLQHGDVQQRRARPEHSGGGVALGDAKCARRAQAGSGFSLNTGREPEPRCGALADPERGDCERRGISGNVACACCEVEGEAWQWERCRATANSSDDAMVDSNSTRSQGQQRRGEG